MGRCRTCNVTILDSANKCPLCHSVLEQTGANAGSQCDCNGYPDVSSVAHRISFIFKLYTFLAIVLEAVLILVNVLFYPGMWWSAVSGIVILYCYLTLRSVVKNNVYQGIMLTQALGVMAVTVAIDWLTGYHGWSVNYVVPSTIILLNLAIIILMFANRAYWHSYILFQIFSLVLSVGCLILWGSHIITFPLPAILAAASSALLFLGTLIFGDRQATGELERRFHV